MKIFANNSLWKKIVIILLVIFSISFIEPIPVNAITGGKLMEPICDLLVGICDGIIKVAHNTIIHQDTTLIRVNLNTTIEDVIRIAITVFAFILAFVALAIVTGGVSAVVGAVSAAVTAGAVTAGTLAGAAASAAVSGIIANIIPIIVGSVIVGVAAYSSGGFTDEVALPLYSISPDKIFSNAIELFDVNFFNPNSVEYQYQWAHKVNFDERYVELTAEEKQEIQGVDFDKRNRCNRRNEKL